MQRTIHAALKKDHAARMAQVNKSIVAKLTEGNVHAAFHHLKGWYWSATKLQVRPCFQTTERQTMEPADLYQRLDSPIPPVIVNVGLLTGDIWDDMPTTNWKIRTTVAELTNGRSTGASHIMRAEHLKEWLKGAKLEEDPEMGPNNVDTRKEWDTLVRLIQAVLDEGKITNKLGWVVTVLIPKGGGDFCGIGLLEPIGISSNGRWTNNLRCVPCTIAFTAVAAGKGWGLR